MYQRIVVKIGTSVLTRGTPHLDHPHMVELVRQCAHLHRAGKEVIICTSGAIAVGRARLDFPDLPPTLNHKQMLAAVGQSRLMQFYERYFEIYGIHVGQLAGLPRPVLQRAAEILHELEATSCRGDGGLAAKQAALFPETSPLLEELSKLDIEGLSPIEALNKLWEWKGKYTKS